jgi:hypothetical protein
MGFRYHEGELSNASNPPSKRPASNSSAIRSRPRGFACIPTSDPIDLSDHTFASIGRFLALVAIATASALIAFADTTGWQILEYDAYLHCGAFAGITLLAVMAFPQVPLSHMLVRLALLGGAIELLQFTPGLNRQPDWSDFGFNVLGIDAMLIAFALVRRVLRPPPSLPAIAQGE